MVINKDNLTGSDIVDLLKQHLNHMAEMSPPESIHALDLNALQQPNITFWSVRESGELLGCGALKELSAVYGEIKSMRTADKHRRKGVAEKMLVHILEEAKQRKYTQISLETGSMDGFIPARKLYEKFDFNECEPFADYSLDPNSIFMTKKL